MGCLGHPLSEPRLSHLQIGTAGASGSESLRPEGVISLAPCQLVWDLSPPPLPLPPATLPLSIGVEVEESMVCVN